MSKRILLTCLVFILCFVAVLPGYASPAPVGAPAFKDFVPLGTVPDFDFYKGKTVVMISQGSPGSGQDAYCRLLAKHIELALGARIAMVDSGGGMGRYFNTMRAAPDGLTFGSMDPVGAYFAQRMEEPGFEWDIRDFAYIGSMEDEPQVTYVGTNKGVKTWEELLKKYPTFKSGFSSLTNTQYIQMRQVYHILGIPMTTVAGYSGSTEIVLSLIKGEIEVATHSVGTCYPLFRNGEALPLFYMTTERVSDYPDVPTILEIAKTDEQRAVLETIVDMTSCGRNVFFARKEVPPERLAALREAFWKAITSPALLEEAAQMQRLIDPKKGAEVQVLVNDMFANPYSDMLIDISKNLKN